jgi:hypothetical protein
MKTDLHFLSYLAHFFLEWEMFQRKVVEKLETYVLCWVNFFLICAFYETMLKNIVEYCRAWQATDIMVHVHQNSKHSPSTVAIYFVLGDVCGGQLRWVHN